MSHKPPVTTDASPALTRCPCGTGETFEKCCRQFHDGTSRAPTAERLMRSRYSAFALGDVDYLLATWHPSTRPSSFALDPDQLFTRLVILGRSGGTMFDTSGTVEFIARWESGDQSGSQRETSRFVKLDTRWYYVEAEQLS